MREINIKEEDINFIGKGIKNCGNSCYMNSVNQMLFHIPELREFMIHNEHLFRYASEKKREEVDSVYAASIGTTNEIYAKKEADHDFDLILKLIGLFKEIKKNTNIHEKIESDRKIMGNATLEDLYISVQAEYFDDTIHQKLEVFDKENKGIITEIERLQIEYNNLRTAQLRKIEIKTRIIEIAKTNNKRILLETIRTTQLESEYIIFLSNNDKRNSDLKELEMEAEKKIPITAINLSDNIFEKLLENYRIIREKLFDQQDAASLFVKYCDSHISIINIINNTDPLIFNTTNSESIINKINIPIFSLYTKNIESLICNNPQIKNKKKIQYFSCISNDFRDNINLDDDIEDMYTQSCDRTGERLINTRKTIKYIPNKYIFIEIKRGYTQILKGEKVCAEFRINEDRYFIDPDTEEIHPYTNLRRLPQYKYDSGINSNPILNYKKYMIIKFNNGTKNINYELIGTICRSTSGTQSGHYWYHHKINRIWYEFNDSNLTENSEPNPREIITMLFRREGDDYTIPLYDDINDMKLNILKQIKDNLMTYDNELSDDLSETDKLKEDINRLLYYTNKYGSNTPQVNHELLEINCKFKEKINSILTP